MTTNTSLESATDVSNMIQNNLKSNQMIGSIIDFFNGQWMGQVLEWILLLLLAIIVYKLGTLISQRLIAVFDKLLEHSNTDIGLAKFLHSLVNNLLKIIVVLTVLSVLGFNLGSLVAIFAAAGVAIGLALKDSLSNIASGIMIIMLKPFQVGDFVDVAGASGKVDSIAIFNSILITGDNKQIVIPNSHITAGNIVNYSAKPTRRVDMIIGVGYDDDLKLVKQLIAEILDTDERVLLDPAYSITVAELADSSVNFNVRPWVASGDYWAFRSDFLENVKASFDKNGVSIPYPQQDVHVHTVNK